jgi:hypothetical protein
VHPDGRLAALGGTVGNVHLWDLKANILSTSFQTEKVIFFDLTESKTLLILSNSMIMVIRSRAGALGLRTLKFLIREIARSICTRLRPQRS